MIPIDLWRARIGLFNCKRCSSSFLSSLFSPSPCFSFHRPSRERHKIVTEDSPIANSPTENSDDHTSHPSNIVFNCLHLSRDCSPFPLKEQITSAPPDYSATASITTTASSSWSGSLSSLRRSLLSDVLIILLIAIISQQLIVLSGDIETNPGPKHGVDEKPDLNDLQHMSIAGEDHFRLMDRLQPHWKNLAIALRFPQYKITTMEHKENPVLYLLNEWLREANMEEDKRPVTWRILIEALHEANNHEEAAFLERHFDLAVNSAVARSQTGKRKYSEVDGNQLAEGKCKCSEVEENQAEGAASMVQEPKRAKVDDPKSCGKMLAHHSSGGYTMSHGPIQVSLKPDVPERVVVLMKEYAKMLLVLRSAKLSKAKLTTLKTFLSDYCEEFSIRKCSTVNSIVDLLIEQLKIYIFNIDTLNASCEYFSSLEVNHSVEQYKQHLDEFLSSTSVKEFKETLQTQIVNPESVEHITLKLDEGRASDTLKKLRQLVFHFFGNISKTFIHCETFAGCVCVTWLVPISLVPTLRTMAQQLSHEYLASHGVLELVIGLRIAPNDKGSKVKEELKDDIEMSEFTSQIVSKVKIEKPQSDKEYGHESEITPFSSDEYEQKFSESLPLTVSSILEQFICYLKHGYLTTEVRPRSLVSLDINDECFLQPFHLRVCNSAGFNRSVDPRSSTNTDIFQFSFSSSNRRDKIKLHGYKHCQNEHKTKLDMADVGKYTDTSTGQLQLAKSILVEGCQGVGKSVLAWKLCKGWAEGELLQEWPIIIVLNFRNRHVREAKTVNDLIYHPDQAMRERVCQELVESEGSQVLAILDGYDQLSDEQETNCSIFKKLITRSLFPQATLMLLSRRVSTGALPEEFLSSINQHIVISGFTDENVKSFITSASSDNLDLASALGSYLNSQSLSYLQIHTPLQCTILTDLYCFHWKNGDKSFSPRTRTELYTDLVHTLLVQYLSSHSEYSKREWHIVEFTDLPGEVYEQFKALAQLAARGIQERVYVFDSGVPEDTLGLMYQVEEMYPDRNRSVSYSFLHLTLQEYLAAYYCSLEETNVRLTKVLKLKESIETFLNLYCSDEMVDYMHHWPVLLFAASITKLSWNPQILHELLQFYSHRQHFVASLVHLLYEIHSPELIALTFQSTADQSTDFKLNITGQGLSDLFVTGYCIPCSNSLWQYTPHDSVTTEHFLDFLKGLQLASSNSCGGHIAKMEVNYYRHVSMLPLLHPHTQRLKELKITYGGLPWMFSGNKKVNCTNVYRKFPHYYPLLEVLEVHAKHSSDIVHLELFESLTRLNSLERLKMRLHYTTPAEVNLMCVYLQACQIRHLVLKDTHTAHKSTLPLMISRKLESLKLCCFSLTSTWAQSICSLRTLHLKYCTFPNDASTALIHSLQSPHCVLHTLELSNAGEYEDEIKYSRVPDTLLGVLVSGSLKRCFLRLNDLSGIEHLISGLKGNNTLEELWVLDEPCLEFWSQLHGCRGDRVQDLICVVNDNTSIKHLKLSSMYKEASEGLNIRPSLKVDFVDNPHDLRDYSEFN